MSDIRISQGKPVIQIESQINQQTGRQSSSSDSQGNLRSLDQGDRIQGKILSVSDEGGSRTVQLSIGQDEVISAKLADGMSLKEGQYVSFEVKGTGSQVTLTPLFENLNATQTMLKALTAAGLEATNDNIKMVQTMMENGAPINKDSISSMHTLVGAHPDTEVSTLVQMKSLNIPINDNTIQQFESYKNYEHKVVETMDFIMDELPEAYNELSQSGDIKAANDLYGKILNMLSDGAADMSKAQVFNGAEQTTLVDSQNASTNVLQNGEAVDESNAQIQNKMQQSGDVITNIPLEENTVSDMSKSMANKVQASLEEFDPNIMPETKEETANKNLHNTNVQNDAENTGTAQNVSSNQLFGALQDKELLDILKSLSKEPGISGNEIQKLISAQTTGELEEIDVAKVLKELSDAYNKSAESTQRSDEAFYKLFSNDGYNKLIKGAMKDQWLIKPEDVSSKENVDNLYQRLNVQAKQLTESLTNSLGAESKIAQSAAGLQNNIDFMNQINQMFHYIQLPLKMTEQDAHGDLYVYSNGKKKFEPGETVSAILHLDMDNLGPVDVYVKMKDNNVKTNFYVADEEVLDLIEEHIDILNERLEKRGYTMQARMMLHTDMDNDSEDMPVDEMFNVKKVSMLSVNSFDARA